MTALRPKEWAVDVFESRENVYGRQHVATQLFFIEQEARNYARNNRCDLQDGRNWAEVRKALPGEKEFA